MTLLDLPAPSTTPSPAPDPVVEPGAVVEVGEVGVLRGHAFTPLRDPDGSTRLERRGVFAGVAAVYLVCSWSVATSGALSVDAMSRTLSAANAIVGRDPHLESIGFVWPPFPAMFQVPLAALSGWFPALVRDGLAGAIVSAVLMAVMVSAVRQWLEECGLGRFGRVAIALCLALHPFVLLFASNGMSEASMLCFLVVAANRLSRWWERETPLDLIVAGAGLAMAYLSRYEVGLSILLVAAAVFAEAVRRADGEPAARARRGVVCAVGVGFIPMSAALVWAGWSWATIGEPFAQFTSQYGNSAIVGGAGVTSGVDRLALFLTQAAVFGGIVLVIGAVGVWFGTRGLARVVSVVLVVMAPLAFNLAAAYSGTTFGFARFTIALVPAAAMLLGPLLVGFARDLGRPRAVVAAASVALVAGFVVLGVLGLPVIRDGRYGTGDEALQLTAIPGPYRSDRPVDRPTQLDAMREIAADIDAMDLPDDSIVTDDFSSQLIVASSRHRTQFITTPDRDFERVLSAPRVFGVKYLLVPDSDNSNYDAVRDVWPGVFEGTNPIGRSVREWGDDTNPGRHYRLIEVAPKGTPGS